MVIGIGGAGGRIAAQIGGNNAAVNVSEAELSRLPVTHKIHAFASTEKGELKGSRKDPQLGRAAFNQVRAQLLPMSKGNTVIASSGGGTGNGISAQLLETFASWKDLQEADRTQFVIVLPYGQREPLEYVENTIEFLQGPLSKAVDSGNTGNIILVSNRLKFEKRLTEDAFNKMIAESLAQLDAIPEKGDTLELLEGHIDPEDFKAFRQKSFFNYFSCFDYDPNRWFGDQIDQHYNELLLRPDAPIEALFLLEIPVGHDAAMFYNILDHFAAQKVQPHYSVVRNPQLQVPRVSVSLLYSRKPVDLVNDYRRVNEEMTRTKVGRHIEQQRSPAMATLEVRLEEDTRRLSQETGGKVDEVTAVLRRIGKLRG